MNATSKLNKRIQPWLLLLLLFTIVLASCTREDRVDATVNKTQLQGTGFTYQNQSDFTINMTFCDMQGNPISTTEVQFYDQNPIVKGTSNWRSDIAPFSKALTDNNGSFSRTLTVGSNIDTVYVVLNHIDFSGPIAVPIQGSSASQVMYPSGYGVIRSSNASRYVAANLSLVGLAGNTSDVIPVTGETPWQYTKSPYASSNLWVLGNFDQLGLPAYLDASSVISSTLTSAISALLPEHQNEPSVNPSLFTNPAAANLVTTAKCQIWVTFISEGAAYQSSLGYFYYPTGSSPATASAISKQIVIFPNCSVTKDDIGGTGEMIQGDRVRLGYYNTTTKQWTDTFPAGITVSWFLISNGFIVNQGANLQFGSGNGLLYSIPSFNPGGYQQCLMLFDQITNSVVLSFEDMPINSGRSDKDFNDVIFDVSANPITAIITNDKPVLKSPSTGDRDGDGVPDAIDAYPDDPQRAYDQYYPTSGVGTLAFEDRWPYIGDYDFNDLVLDYKYHLVLNAAYAVKDVKITYYVKAVGASYRNGFGIQFGTGAGNVQSVSGQVNMAGNKLFSLSSTGYENGQTYAVIPVFPDASQLFGYTSGTPPFINTAASGGVTADSLTINLTVTFETPVDPSALGSPPYNVFLVANQNRGIEIHLAGQMPTGLANTSLFGVGDDKTNVSTKTFYVGAQEAPWALNMPTMFSYPFEGVNINQAYLKFSPWVQAIGASYTDWYYNTGSGYRNSAKIYH
jgi:LruC domain-containing protein